MFFSILKTLVPDAHFALQLLAFTVGGFLVGLVLRKALMALSRRMQGAVRAGTRPLRRIVAGTLFETVARTSVFLFTGLGVVAFREFTETTAPLSEEETGALARLFWIFLICAQTIFLWHCVRLPVALVRRYASPKNKSAATLLPLLSALLKIFVVALGVLIVIRITTDTQPAEILAMLGIGGLALGLAAQDSVKNFFGSVMLIVDRPFQVGDSVDVGGGTAGTVEEVGVRSTRIRSRDGALLCIPNGDLANRTIRTVTARETIRDEFRLGLTYDTTPEKIEEALAILAELIGVPECVREGSRAPRIHFDAFGESSLDLAVVYHFASSDYAAFLRFKSALNLAILRRFAAAGIEFAFPTISVETK